jgi:ribosomal protein S18 acetylase RimI-like enzyme
MTMICSALRIRAATADDVNCMHAIARAAYAKYVLRIGREPAPMVADYAAAIAEHGAVVIESAGSVCGYMIAWSEGDAYFIENIGVDPACQKAGLGRRLIEHAAAEARNLHLTALCLYTNELMTENLSMYAHLGFVETHRAVEHGFRRVYMRRPLPAGGA